MIVERAYLGAVTIGLEAGEPRPVLDGADFTDLEEYSQFKYGEGRAALKYGRMLGALMVGEYSGVFFDNEVYVASSAFRVAPPASQGLVVPFVETARSAAASQGAETAIRTFKIGKSRLATDGYADMTFEERRGTLQSDLILPEGLDFRGRTVVMLDDIRVTGLREEALEGLFTDAGAEQTLFGYALTVSNGREFPKIEGMLNRIAVKTMDDIIELASRPGFIPNVRLCKFIAARPPEEVARFCATAPPEVAETVVHYIEAEDLENIVKIVP
jgi:hypothetical protein